MSVQRTMATLSMSSNNHAIAGLGVLIILGLSGAPRAPGQNVSTGKSLACPSEIELTETASGVQGWQSHSVRVKRSFERVSIYNGSDGAREYELAPDEERESRGRITQEWHLKGYRSLPIFLRCRYVGTEAVLSAGISNAVENCTFTFSTDRTGKITGRPSFTCR
jgi:hypothetical protein